MGDISTPRSGRRPRRWWLVALVGLLGVGSEPSSGHDSRGGPPPVSPLDHRLAPLRAAAESWERRQGPDRAVVDQVCLVPDVATFLRAIRGWDRTRFYPILIETDAPSTLRFLRAFRPSRVVRMPPAAPVAGPDALWSAAGASIAASWREPGRATEQGGSEPCGADPPRPPAALGPTPPGVVLANPSAPMLAGAVALAAGRFQPLVRFETPGGFHRTLTLDELHLLDRDLTGAVARIAPDHLALGDSCDFVTLAGDYPYRYGDAEGDEAVDDALARVPASGSRWAYVGRLLGDAEASVYRAMCSLFLQPVEAALFNGYDEHDAVRSFYATRGPAVRLASRLTTSHHAGPVDATVAAWHEAFDPENRSGLIWINSHGSPTVFHLRDEPASTTDVPRTVPTAVVMIHSYSASDPTDPSTIAGRWLDHGAFAYFGSLNEPYLQSFRTPQLALELARQHLPLVASLRATAIEPYGTPWRLVYLGDPLFRLRPPRAGVLRRDPGRPPAAALVGRATPPGATSDLPIVARADHDEVEADRFAGSIAPEADAVAAWESAWDSAIGAAIAPAARPSLALADAIRRLDAVDRDRLPADLQARLDLALADSMFQANRRGELRSRIEAIPPAARPEALNRWLDTLRGIDFAHLLGRDDFDRLLVAWTQIIAADAPTDFQAQATARVGAHATDPGRRADWIKALRAAPARQLAPAVADAIAAEIRRVAGLAP